MRISVSGSGCARFGLIFLFLQALLVMAAIIVYLNQEFAAFRTRYAVDKKVPPSSAAHFLQDGLLQWLPSFFATEVDSGKSNENRRKQVHYETTPGANDKVRDEILAIKNYAETNAEQLRSFTRFNYGVEIPDNNAGELADLPKCPNTSPLLVGYRTADLMREPASLEKTEAINKLVTSGGEYKPPDCRAICKVAIIIPLRNRGRHLRYFLQYMHPILQRQQLHYKIYVINQIANGTFNRAKLMNVGYAEALRDGFQCYVFHDVDLVLTNDRCPYACQSRPVHLAHYVDKFQGLLYPECVGGVLAMSREQFERVNGFSNLYWGWGGEDDDMYWRMTGAGMHVMRHPMRFARYKMIRHEPDAGNEMNPRRFELLQMTNGSFADDGINSLNYELSSYDETPLYTNVTVNLFAAEESERVRALFPGNFTLGGNYSDVTAGWISSSYSSSSTSSSSSSTAPPTGSASVTEQQVTVT